MTKRYNPSAIAAPLGKYTHGIEVPDGARWLCISGQVGINPDGAIGDGFEAQCRTAYANLQAILAEAGMGFEDVVKSTIFLTDQANVAAYRAIRDEFLGDNRPASTLLIVAGLASPDFLVEVEMTAAKA